MLEAYYRLGAEPFRLTPDHHFSFPHPSYSKAKAYMEYAVYRAEGFVMVTGAPGSGKTTLVQDLFGGLDRQNLLAVKIVTTQLDDMGLLRLLAHEFGIDSQQDKASLLSAIQQLLARQYHNQRRALIIVDEAQDLQPSALEELRLLTNFTVANQPLVQIFLVGQEGLRELVQQPAMDQLHQRIIAACHLQTLTREQTEDYIYHRLRTAGWQQDPTFTSAVFDLIHAFTGGMPRRINMFCARLILQGAVTETHQLTLDNARQVAQEMRDEQLSWVNTSSLPVEEADDPEAAADTPEPLQPAAKHEHSSDTTKEPADKAWQTHKPTSASHQGQTPAPPEATESEPATAADQVSDSTEVPYWLTEDAQSFIQHGKSRQTEPKPTEAWSAETTDTDTDIIKQPSHSVVATAGPGEAMFPDADPASQPNEALAPRKGPIRVLGVNILWIIGSAILGIGLTYGYNKWFQPASVATASSPEQQQTEHSSQQTSTPAGPASGPAATTASNQNSSAAGASSAAKTPARPQDTQPALSPQPPSTPADSSSAAAARAGESAQTSAQANKPGAGQSAAQPQQPSLRERLQAALGAQLAGIETAANGLRLDLDNCLSFPFDSNDLTDKAKTCLDGIAQFAIAHPKSRLLIQGQADDIGELAYNEHLANKRAAIVANYLTKQDVPNSQVVTEGVVVPYAPDNVAAARSARIVVQAE